MIQFIRTTSENTDFKELVIKLDKDLSIRDGDEHAFYSQFNKIDTLKNVIVAYMDEQPVACGAFKQYSANKVEIKRMFVLPQNRCNGIASSLLLQLEKWAFELGNTICMLETGVKQPEAIRLYEKNGYRKIPNFGQYAEVVNSVCFEKIIK